MKDDLRKEERKECSLTWGRENVPRGHQSLKRE
jgi:hypothetical protein